MQKFLLTFLDLILPRSNFENILRDIDVGDFLESAGGLQPQEIDEIRHLLSYKNRFTRNAIWALKYKNNKDVVRLFAELSHDYLLELAGERDFFGHEEKFILVPIPISKTHMRERGHNQCVLILKELQKLDKENFEYDYKGLIKSRETISQTKTKNRAERIKNVKNSFDVRDDHRFLDKKIILIDDVATTGSTLREAKRILKEAGAKEVMLVAIAH